MGTPGWYPGRCKDCAAPAVEDRARCAACAEEHRKAAAAARRARKAEGLCTVCGARAVRVSGEALTTCKTHREYFRSRATKSL